MAWLHMAHVGELPPIWDLLDHQPAAETLHLLMSFTYSDLQHLCPQRRLLNHLRKDALEVVLVHAIQACSVFILVHANHANQALDVILRKGLFKKLISLLQRHLTFIIRLF